MNNKKDQNKLPLWINVLLQIAVALYLFYILTTPFIGTPKIPPASMNR